MSITGFRDEHPDGCDVKGGEAGVIYHRAGVGHVVILLDDEDEEIYIPSKHLARFARLYRVLGEHAIANFKESPIDGEVIGAMHSGNDKGSCVPEAEGAPDHR
jgi:hypothetical protein